MQKEWKVLTAFRWQSDGWAGRLEGKCSRGLLSGHTRAPFNKVQRWAAPQHIAREWEEGEWEWREGWVRLTHFSQSFSTCHACEPGIPHMCMGAEIGNPQSGQALKIFQSFGWVPAIMLILDMPVTLSSPHAGMNKPQQMCCISSLAVPTVEQCNVRSDYVHVVIQPILLIVVLCSKLIWTMAEDRQK